MLKAPSASDHPEEELSGHIGSWVLGRQCTRCAQGVLCVHIGIQQGLCARLCHTLDYAHFNPKNVMAMMPRLKLYNPCVAP